MILVLSLCGCENQLANTAITQDEKITSFIESRYKDVPVIFNEGVNRIVLEEGDSTHFAVAGDLVNFSYVGYQFNGNIGGAFTSGDAIHILGQGEMIKGLELGISGMCPGEKSYIVFSCKYGYDKTVAGIGRDQALLFEVLMNDIKPQ
ncbi:MAG: FKBP-type peptidyl-prolyl cis-trans isomerase [Bacteroidales bacterium]|nr:FKBP-type peptidyl-prolyl cis-trans isomerase [Bacteroidales bacterium]